MPDLATVVAALRSGASVILPTDTVYGLAADASSEEAAANLYRLKGRDAIQPTAVVFGSVEQLIRLVPEVDDTLVRALLPGAVTLVVPNPERRYRWLCGPDGRLGVRVPRLSQRVMDILEASGPVVTTSANLPGGPDPRRLGEIPAELARGVAAAVDGGELPGLPSTVVELGDGEPRILREGAVPAEEVLAAVSAAKAGR